MVDENSVEAFYGLPKKVKFCKRCVVSNQRPNSAIEFQHQVDSRKETIRLDEHGICDACRLAQRKKEEIDWVERERELRELCDQYRKNGKGFDCLVPGSGGKDSFYAAHKLKYTYGMNPLTVTWAPNLYTDWGWKNFQGWLRAGFDNYLITPNPRTHRLITRLALENLFHPFQPFMMGQKSVAPRLASLFNIPLVFYGENEAEYGNPVQATELAIRDWCYFTESDPSKIYLGGVALNDLKKKFGLSGADLNHYLPIDPELVHKIKLEVHYLGYYLSWHPQGSYYYAVENGEFEPSPERTPGTYSKYNSIDDKIDDFHYYATYIKYGIGRATYDAAQEIRNREISREEGVALVKKFDGEFPERFADEIFRYLSLPVTDFPVAHHEIKQPIMNRESFDSLTDTFRSPHLWKITAGGWNLRHHVW